LNSDLLQGFYLGDVLIEPLQGRVTGRATSAHLPPKAAEVLLQLASQPGEVVSREALIEAVWGPGHGSAEALSHAVGEIRHALEDHADQPRYIQTLPKRGYRLIVTPELLSHGNTSVVIGADKRAQLGLFENLKQRGVLETGLAYLVLGWLLIQVIDVVFSQLHFPETAGTFVTTLIIAGFPIALVVSWFLEFRDGRAVVVTQLSPRDAQRRRFSRTYMSVIGGLAVAAVFVFAYDRVVGLPRGNDATIAATEALLPPVFDNSIAVLPFLNLDGSDETAVFATGLVDDVITRLSRVPGLRVSSRGDAFTLEPNTASQKVRERLRVSKYLEGSVQIAGDEMRVIVQLIDSATGFHLLSRKFDRPRSDFFDLRDEITELTVANVRVAMPAALRDELHQSSDRESLDVYVLYRRGIDTSRLPHTPENITAALDWFDAALEVDPGYAAAHAGKCTVYVQAYAETHDAGYIDKAEEACASALALNANLYVVYTALGTLYYATGRYADAEQSYQQALAINSNSVAALTGLGDTRMMQQQPDQAEAYYRQAIGLHPGDWDAYNKLGFFLFHSGRYIEAAEEYGHVVALDHDNMTGYSNLGTAWMLAGDFAAAADALQKSVEIRPRPTTLSNLGLMYYYLGRDEDAIAAQRKAVELAPNDHLRWSNLGDVLVAGGNEGEARQAFETAKQLVADALGVNPNDPNTLMDAAWINASLGDLNAARALLERARALAPDDPYVHYIDGLVRLRGGDADAALAALEAAAARGYPLRMLAGDPLLAPLHGEPRFGKILGKAPRD
jgi:tetratricopeptide (TPR) repeat protein/TolB-like protein/DNA-binding winged helix-turn-helix (wHTH) protein